MKATITTGTGLSFISRDAEIPNIPEDAEMTAQIAQSFSRVAFGHTLGTTVYGGRKIYRCTKSRVRRLRPLQP